MSAGGGHVTLAHVDAPGSYLWWLSFINPDLTPPPDEQRPGGVSFLGVAIVEASNLMSAVRESHRLGCNPGGQVQGSGPMPLWAVGVEWRNRLLSYDEVQQIPEPEAS